MWVLGYGPWRSVLCFMTEPWRDVWVHTCVHVCAHWRRLCVCICADLCLSTRRYASDTPTLPDLSSESMCSAGEVNELLIPGVHIRAHLDLRQTRRLAGEGVRFQSKGGGEQLTASSSWFSELYHLRRIQEERPCFPAFLCWNTR